jgi:hypothetical protein
MRRRAFLGRVAIGGFGFLGTACRCCPKYQTMIDLHEVSGSAIIEASPLPSNRGQKADSHNLDDIINHAMWIGASRWAKKRNGNYICAFWTGQVKGEGEVLEAKYEVACVKRPIATVIHSNIPRMDPEMAMAEADKIAVERSPLYIAGLWDGEMVPISGKKKPFTHNVIAIKDTGWVKLEEYTGDLGQLDSPARLYSGHVYRTLNAWVNSMRPDGAPSPYIAAFPLYRPGSNSDGSRISVLCFRRDKN